LCASRATRFPSTTLFRSALAADIISTAQMVGMGVGFQYILQGKALIADMFQHPVGGYRGGTAGLLIKIQHRINNGGTATGGVGQHMSVGRGVFMQKTGDGDCAHYWYSVV